MTNDPHVVHKEHATGLAALDTARWCQGHDLDANLIEFDESTQTVRLIFALGSGYPDLPSPPPKEVRRRWFGWSSLTAELECQLLIRRARALSGHQNLEACCRERGWFPQVSTVEFDEQRSRLTLRTNEVGCGRIIENQAHEDADGYACLHIEVEGLEVDWLVTDRVHGWLPTYGLFKSSVAENR